MAEEESLWDRTPVHVEKISHLIFDWRLYPRKEIDHSLVRRYARALQAGSVFPPVKCGLFAERKFIVDGVHRVKSRELLHIKYADCALMSFETEAELFAEAVRLNSGHGKGFSNVEVRANIQRLKKYNFNVEEIVALVHVPASEIHRERVAGSVTTPSGRKIYCKIQKVDCDGYPTTRELIQLKNALMLIRDVARKGCIPMDDYFNDLVLQCRSALEKVRFNG